jgi:hypothetical protein
MALVNPKLFGLDINRSLADVLDKNLALSNLNLPPIDLDVIRGSKNAGATLGDWISFSRLSVPIYKNLDRYYQDSSLYNSILDSKAGTNQTLFGNLIINGRLSGNAVRYRYVDGTGPSAAIKLADISTSRVSAWSSVGVGTTVPISYGARVGIITGGQLQFGTQSPSSSVSGPRLRTTLSPQAKEFNSELPTHKIQCTIGGNVVNLYAMKGIPVIFKGFFKSLDATITLTSLLNNIPSSWKIVDVDNSNSYSNFPDRGSSLSYRATISKERYIQFYYNPDRIATITINSANISEIPEVKFSSLSSFNFASNSLVNFPNFTSIAPSLQELYLSYNPFYNSDTPTERSLNSNVVSKIPTGLQILSLGGSFYGSIPENLISSRFTSLKTLDLSRGGGAYFHPDSADSNCTLPNVPNTCESYNVYANDFRAFGTTLGISTSNVKDLTNVASINLGGNYYLVDSSFSISASNTKLRSLNIYNTAVSCPDLSNRTSFVSITASYNRNIGSIFTGSNNYKFAGCSALTSLDFYASPLTGAMPKFTNSNLTYIDWRYTNITGGNIGGTASDDVIPEKTFEESPKLVYFFLQSDRLLQTKINENAFSYTPDLYYFWYISYGRTGGGLPNFGSCKSLTWVVAPYNAFNGTLYNFASNLNLYYIDVSYNQFSSSIPAFKNLTNLHYLFLYNNSFTGLQKFQNLANLMFFYAHNNSITGQIPDFTECPRMYYLILFNNQLSTYYSGSFSQLYILRYLDLSNNSLSEQALNSIIDDLYTNYTAVKRGGVTVNIKNQTGGAIPTGTALEKVVILRSKGWSIVYE